MKMAWISIHEEVDGPKLRRLYGAIGCSKFEALGILTFVWFWGLKNADETGLVRDTGLEVLSRYLYGCGDKSSVDMDKAIKSLVETGWIDIEGNGFRLHDWDQWQEQWYKLQRTRAYNAERKRAERQREKDGRKNTTAPPPQELQVPEAHTSEPVESGNPPAKPPETKYTPAFEAWWEVYPRKTDKGYAYKKYLARRKDGYSDADLIIAAKKYAAQCKKFKTEKQYIKHPKTFLSDALPFLEFIPENPVTVAVTVTDDNPYEEWGEQNE